jgi:hypothetical protein
MLANYIKTCVSKQSCNINCADFLLLIYPGLRLTKAWKITSGHLTVTCILYTVQLIWKISYCINSESIKVSQCNTKTLIVNTFVLVRYQNIYTQFRGKFVFHLHRKSPISSLNNSLFITIIPKANYTFREAPMLLYVTHKNCPNILPLILPHIVGSSASTLLFRWYNFT